MRKFLCLQFIFSIALSSTAQKNPCDQAGVPYSSLPGDTTIVLKSGTTITFNRCEFFDVKDCIEIKDIETPEDMERERLQMFDDRGNLLLSYGMIVINLDSCNKKNFEVPVKLRMKVNNALSCYDSAQIVPFLFLNGSRGWAKPDISSRAITINGEKYVEFETRTPAGAWNLDVLKNGRPVKFKAPKGYTIHRIKLGFGCPLFFINRYPEKNKRSIKIKIRCVDPAGGLIEYFLANKKKDSALFKRQTNLSLLNHGEVKLKCTAPKPSLFGRMFDWKPKERGEIRRKYYLSVSN